MPGFRLFDSSIDIVLTFGFSHDITAIFNKVDSIILISNQHLVQ